jgi:hypothetical protein
LEQSAKIGMLFQIWHNLKKLRAKDFTWPHFDFSIEGAKKKSRDCRGQGRMSTNRFLDVWASGTRLDDQPGKFTSRWAIPRVEPQIESRSKKKKRQINNLVLLFVIHVFKQLKKFLSA